jgi:hypothetical protein
MNPISASISKIPATPYRERYVDKKGAAWELIPPGAFNKENTSKVLPGIEPPGWVAHTSAYGNSVGSRIEHGTREELLKAVESFSASHHKEILSKNSKEGLVYLGLLGLVGGSIASVVTRALGLPRVSNAFGITAAAGVASFAAGVAAESYDGKRGA